MRLSIVKFETSLRDYNSSRDQILKEVRQVKSNGKTVVGKHASSKNQTMVSFESSLESDFATMLEYDSDIARFSAQPVKIDFMLEGRKRSYTPDFLVHYRQDRYPGSTMKPMLCEVKYRADLKKNWKKLKPKFMSALRYADEQGWSFKIMTEVEIRTIYQLNAKFLLPYKNRRIDPVLISVVFQTLDYLQTTTPGDLIVQAAKDFEVRAELVSALWYMISQGQVGCNLHDEKLTMSTVIWYKTNEMFLDSIPDIYVKNRKRR